MATDVAYILTKGRHPFRALRSHLVADRAPGRSASVREDGRCTFDVEGAVPADAVERAIALSHEKYCSVWHSMQQDIDFR